MQRLLLFCFLLLRTLSTLAQVIPDSAPLEPSQVREGDTAYLNSYIRRSKAFMLENNLEQALVFGVTSLEISITLEYKKGKVESLTNLGRISSMMGKYELALDYQHQALEIYEETGNTEGILECVNELADIHNRTKEYEQAMEYKFQAIELEKKITNNHRAIAKSLTQIAALYAELGNYELAFNKSTEAVKIFETSNDRKGLGECYKVLGLIHAKSKTYRQALEYLRKALTIKESIKNSTDIGEILNSIGDAYNNGGSPQQATTFYQQAYDKARAADNKKGITECLIKLGNNAIDMKKYTEASNYLKQALQIAEKIESKEDIDKCYLYLSTIYENNHNIAEALKYYKLYNQYQKEILNENTKKKVAEMHEIIETNRRKKELDTEIQKQKNQKLEIANANKSRDMLRVIIAFIVLSLLVALFFVRLYRSKSKQLAASNAIITQKNIMMEDLNNTKNKFFSIIAHDLKAPLNSLSGFSNLIINHIEYLSKEEIKMMAVDLDKSVRNLYDLLNNLLTWARSQMNTIEFKPQNLSMHDIFADLVGLIELNAQNKKIHISTNLPEDIIVFADDNALKTILRNLASNALKFTPEGGKITLSAKNYDQNYVQIAVNDTGVGMDAITMTKIFRIDSKHSTKGTEGEAGTGLGLLLCKEFAEKNGGTITVESIVEVGTTFKVLLPKGENKTAQ